MSSTITTAVEALIAAEVERQVAARIGERTEPYSVDEAAAELRLAKSTIYGLVRDGKLTTIPTGTRRVLIPAAEVRRLMTQQTDGAA